MERLVNYDKAPKLIKQALIAVGLGSGALLASCASAEILPNRPAEVIEKIYDDSDTVMVGAKPPIFVTYPEEYLLTVTQCDRSGDDFADDRGCVTDTVEVSEETYNAYDVGSYITFVEE